MDSYFNDEYGCSIEPISLLKFTPLRDSRGGSLLPPTYCVSFERLRQYNQFADQRDDDVQMVDIDLSQEEGEEDEGDLSSPEYSYDERMCPCRLLKVGMKKGYGAKGSSGNAKSECRRKVKKVICVTAVLTVLLLLLVAVAYIFHFGDGNFGSVIVYKSVGSNTTMSSAVLITSKSPLTVPIATTPRYEAQSPTPMMIESSTETHLDGLTQNATNVAVSNISTNELLFNASTSSHEERTSTSTGLGMEDDVIHTANANTQYIITIAAVTTSDPLPTATNDRGVYSSTMTGLKNNGTLRAESTQSTNSSTTGESLLAAHTTVLSSTTMGILGNESNENPTIVTTTGFLPTETEKTNDGGFFTTFSANNAPDRISEGSLEREPIASTAANTPFQASSGSSKSSSLSSSNPNIPPFTTTIAAALLNGAEVLP